MASELAVPKGKKVKAPLRDPDYHSPRGVAYWWAPEWIRLPGFGSYGRIKPIAVGKKVELHMLSKTGNLTYIQGRIQEEFLLWHEDHEIDCILLGADPNDILVTDWEYE